MNRQVQASSVYWTGEYADRFRDGFANFTVGVTRDLGQVLAQAAKLEKLSMGLMREAQLWREDMGPLYYAERREYLAALHHAINGLLTLEDIHQLGRKLRDPINCAAIVTP